MKQSALHPVHLQLNAKMIDFQGWQMPFQYAGTAEEHLAVRTAAGLFDVSHIGGDDVMVQVWGERRGERIIATTIIVQQAVVIFKK